MDSAHEFLILDVFDGKYSIQLRAERVAVSRKPGGPDDAVSCIWTNTSRISRVLKKIDESQVYKIAVVKCFPRSIVTLPDICDIFRMLHERAPNYSLFEYQCYWFCAAFMWDMEEKAKVPQTKGKDFERRGKARGSRTEDGIREDAEKYIEALETCRRDAQQAESAERQQEIIQGYMGVVARRKQEGARMIKKAQEVVTPLLLTSETKRLGEERALRTMLSRVASEVVEKREKEKGKMDAAKWKIWALIDE